MIAPISDMSPARQTTRISRRARPARSGAAQRGAALLTAMIIVTLVSTLAAAMVWQQWRAVQVESAERDRTQFAWTLSSALQFASLVLRESAKSNSNNYTALTDIWATPLAEGRVSTLNGTDKTTADDDDSQGFLSGSIEDAQARYNLLNLLTPINGATPIKYQEDPTQLQILESLCKSASVDTSVASRISSELAAAANSAGAGASLMPETIDQLVWFGIDQAEVDRLRPYVALLTNKPISTTAKTSTLVNANTASLIVLSAIVSGADAQKILQRQRKTPFKTVPELQDYLGTTPISSKLGVNSNYFEVNGRLRLTDRVLAQQSLVYRDSANQVTALRSRRVSSIEQVAP